MVQLESLNITKYTQPTIQAFIKVPPCYNQQILTLLDMSNTTKKLFPLKNRAPRTRSETKKTQPLTKSQFDTLLRDALSLRCYVAEVARGLPSRLSKNEVNQKRLGLVEFAKIRKEDLPSYCRIPSRSDCGCLATHASNDCYGWCLSKDRSPCACSIHKNYGPYVRTRECLATHASNK